MQQGGVPFQLSEGVFPTIFYYLEILVHTIANC